MQVYGRFGRRMFGMKLANNGKWRHLGDSTPAGRRGIFNSTMENIAF
jgi:hypothetical protein